MALVVPSDQFLFDRSNKAREFLNGLCGLHLFSNQVPPSIGARLVDFTESTFPGYAAQSTVDKFQIPLKIQDGWYRTVSDPFVFVPTATVEELIWGYYISIGPLLYLACTFDEGVPCVVAAPISVTIGLDDIATFVFPP